MNITKKDNKTIIVNDTKQVETSTEYNYGELKKQELAIEKQISDFLAKRNKELEEVRYLISEAEKLGITDKLEEEYA